jgi:hypothetical protein
MAVMTSAGSTLALSAVLPATYDAAGFNALTWTNIGEVTNLGDLGKEYTLVTYTPLASRRVQKLKGSYNQGSMQLELARDTADAGQTALRTARDSDNAYAFRLTLQNGTKLYFTGVVMGYKTSVGSTDQITSASATLEIVSDITEV